jgi:hypothetical protein
MPRAKSQHAPGRTPAGGLRRSGNPKKFCSVVDGSEAVRKAWVGHCDGSGLARGTATTGAAVGAQRVNDEVQPEPKSNDFAKGTGATGAGVSRTVRC